MQLSTYTAKILSTLEQHKGEGGEIVINLMPLTGKLASRHYQEAVGEMLREKGSAYQAWKENEVKFIVDKS